MGTVIEVQTTDGKQNLDVSKADWVQLRIGGTEYRIDAPHVVELFEAYMASSHAHQQWEDGRRRIREQQELSNEITRSFLNGR